MSVWAKLNACGKRAFYPLAAWMDAWLCVVTHQFVDPDLWGRLSVGALYFQTGRFPYRDVFSYSAPNARWVDHEWLTGFVFYQLLTRAGEPALMAFQAAILLSLLVLIFGLHRQVYQVSGLFLFYGSLLLSRLYCVGFYPAVRSHVFSFLGFVGFIVLLEKMRLHKLSLRWLWVFPILLAVWGNLHGGVAMGFLVLGCYGLSAGLQQKLMQQGFWRASVPYGLAFLGGVALLGVLNPYGFSYWGFLLSAWFWDRAHIQEWSPLALGSGLRIEQQVLVLGTAMLLALNGWVQAKVSGGGWRCWLTSAPVLVLVFLVAMTLKSVRLQSFLALGLLAYIPLLLSPAFLRGLGPGTVNVTVHRGLLLTRILPGLLALGVLVGLVFMGQQRSLWTVPVEDELGTATTEIRYPVAAIEYLKQSPYRGNLLVRFGLGEFAYWQLYPRFKVSMDGRYEEVYSQAQFLTNNAFFDRKRPDVTIETARHIHQTRADFILIEANMPNLATLEQSDQWQLLYGDNHFRLFGRSGLQPFVPSQPIITNDVLTITDFTKPEALRRFRF